MPSLTHEGLVLLFRNAPTLAAQLLRDALNTPLPLFESARIGEADVTEPVPVTFTADLVIVLEQVQKPVCALVVEPQLDPIADKRRTWPHYLTGTRAKLNCDVVLLVVAVDEEVARWAATPIPLGHPGFCLTPLVLGPHDIPRILDPAQAKQSPELAVLGVMAHGQDEEPERAIEMSKAALIACKGLPADRALSYTELVLSSLNHAAKVVVEELMESKLSGQALYEGEVARVLRRVFRKEGRIEGESRALLAFLEARNVSVPNEARERILACTETDVLDRWIRKAATAVSVDELFQEA